MKYVYVLSMYETGESAHDVVRNTQSAHASLESAMDAGFNRCVELELDSPVWQQDAGNGNGWVGDPGPEGPRSNTSFYIAKLNVYTD